MAARRTPRRKRAKLPAFMERQRRELKATTKAPARKASTRRIVRIRTPVDRSRTQPGRITARKRASASDRRKPRTGDAVPTATTPPPVRRKPSKRAITQRTEASRRAGLLGTQRSLNPRVGRGQTTKPSRGRTQHVRPTRKVNLPRSLSDELRRRKKAMTPAQVAAERERVNREARRIRIPTRPTTSRRRTHRHR